MKDSWTALLAYPVHFEGKSDAVQTEWETIYAAPTQADMEFRMNSYQFPVFPFMRIRDANGQIFEVTRDQLLNYNEKTTALTQQKVAPLKAFVGSAPEKALETAQELIRAGMAAKHFVIPPRASVLINHPNLHHLRLLEFEDSVVCRIHVNDTEPDETEPSVTIWKLKDPVEFSITPNGLDVDVSAFLVILCTSIVRDFWVLETRTKQRTYQRRTEKTRQREGTGKDRKLAIQKDYVFIPRFEYDLSSYQSQPRSVSHQVRVTLSPHLVSGHLRNLPEGWKPSEGAIEKAKEFGIQLGDGQTFVSPHERGAVEQLRSYRSRSALEMLFGKK